MSVDYTIRVKGASRTTEVNIDDGATYNLDLAATDWGVATQPEPQEQVHDQGATLYLALEEVWQRRVIRLVGWVDCPSGLLQKNLVKSQLNALFQGQRTLRRYGWEIDVTGMAPVEREDSMLSPMFLAFEVMLLATPPFWTMADNLAAIGYGDGLLYADHGVFYGEAQPAYVFSRTPAAGEGTIAANPGAGVAHFTITNWGTGYAYPEVSFTGFPTSTTLYVEGPGRFRVKKTTSGAGAFTITAADRLFLAPGANAIRFEDAAGTATNLTSFASAKADFSATRFRFV